MSNPMPRLRRNPGFGEAFGVSEVGPFLSAGVALLALVVSLILALRKESVSVKDQSIERRLVSLENGAQSHRALIDAQAAAHAAELRTLRDNLHNDEKETIRLQGQVNTLHAQHGGFERDLSEIKDKMVHRDEWEAGNQGLHKRFDDLWNALQKKTFPSATGYSAVRPPPQSPVPDSTPPRR